MIKTSVTKTWTRTTITTMKRKDIEEILAREMHIHTNDNTFDWTDDGLIVTSKSSYPDRRGGRT